MYRTFKYLELLSERFVEVFQETVSENPRVEVTEELEVDCIGCMAARASITWSGAASPSQRAGRTPVLH